MRATVEVTTNIIIIAVAVMLGSVFLRDRFSTPPETNIVKPGDTSSKLDGWDWSAQDKTLVMVLRKGCHFCEDSTPFYQRLISQQQRREFKAALVAVFPDPADAVKQVAQSEGLNVQALAGVPLEKLRVSGTPTLLLVDRAGKVLGVWAGMLSPRQEVEVIRSMTGAIQNIAQGPG